MTEKYIPKKGDRVRLVRRAERGVPFGGYGDPQPGDTWRADYVREAHGYVWACEYAGGLVSAGDRPVKGCWGTFEKAPATAEAPLPALEFKSYVPQHGDRVMLRELMPGSATVSKVECGDTLRCDQTGNFGDGWFWVEERDPSYRTIRAAWGKWSKAAEAPAAAPSPLTAQRTVITLPHPKGWHFRALPAHVDVPRIFREAEAEGLTCFTLGIEGGPAEMVVRRDTREHMWLEAAGMLDGSFDAHTVKFSCEGRLWSPCKPGGEWSYVRDEAAAFIRTKREEAALTAQKEAAEAAEKARKAAEKRARVNVIVRGV